MAKLNPWDRQEGEGKEAYEAFKIYLEMGPDRSIPKVAQKCTKSESLLKRWSSGKTSSKKDSETHESWRWTPRVDAWDDYQSKETFKALSKGTATMAKKHVEIAQVLQVKALKAFKSLKEEHLSAKDIVRIIDLSVKLERISRGESTENQRVIGTMEHEGTVTVNVHQDIDLSDLSEEELSQLEKISAKLAGKTEN